MAEADAAWDGVAVDANVLTGMFSAADLMAVEFPPVTAGELVNSGECSGQCLVAADDSCECKCGGFWHGALAAYVVLPNVGAR